MPGSRASGGKAGEGSQGMGVNRRSMWEEQHDIKPLLQSHRAANPKVVVFFSLTVKTHANEKVLLSVKSFWMSVKKMPLVGNPA